MENSIPIPQGKPGMEWNGMEWNGIWNIPWWNRPLEICGSRRGAGGDRGECISGLHVAE